MVNTIKFSEFANIDLDNSTNKIVGFSTGVNFKGSYIISWTTSGRPAVPLDGILGYNTSLHKYEYYDSNSAAWIQLQTNASSGTVNTGTINQLTYYASTGNTVSGLPTHNSSVLTTSSSGAPTWSSTMTNGQVIIGSTGSTPTAANLTAGANVTITNSAAGITIAASGSSSGIMWNTVAGTTQAASVNNAYICLNGSLTTITLPAIAPIGSIVQIIGEGAGGWTLQANAGQTIALNSSTTSSGGTCSSTNKNNSLSVVCKVANTTWGVWASEGSIIVA